MHTCLESLQAALHPPPFPRPLYPRGQVALSLPQDILLQKASSVFALLLDYLGMKRGGGGTITQLYFTVSYPGFVLVLRDR